MKAPRLILLGDCNEEDCQLGLGSSARSFSIRLRGQQARALAAGKGRNARR